MALTARVIQVRGRWVIQVNGGPVTNEQHIAVSYGRREDAEQMTAYWLEHGHWLGQASEARGDDDAKAREAQNAQMGSVQGATAGEG